MQWTKGQTIIYKTLHRNLGWTHVLRKGRQFLIHMWHPSCYSISIVHRRYDVIGVEQLSNEKDLFYFFFHLKLILIIMKISHLVRFGCSTRSPYLK